MENENTQTEPLIISYFTPSYEKYAMRLRACCRIVSIESHIVPLKTRGSWQRNCAYKPRFILDQYLANKGRPIIWLDADATIEREPLLFTKDRSKLDDYDLALRTCNTNPPHPWNAIMTGTMYLNHTERTEKILRQWVTACQLKPTRWDQYSLKLCLDTKRLPEDEIKVFDLPEHYCAVTDRRMTDEAMVIAHWQASRTNKAIEGDEGDSH